MASGNYPNDLDNQSAGNYTYDAAGNLLTDQQAAITANMTWSVYGKLLTISSKSLSYQYDASGNRIGKTAGSTSTWYVRDAQGNVLSVYSGTGMALSEQHLYGSSRLGLINGPTALAGTAQFLDNLGSGTLFTFTRGKKLFELSNHLGNVLATVSDKKFGTPVSGIPSQISYYIADVKTAQDYYPFGMEMPGRQYNSTTYAYTFNGKRDDKDAEYGWQDYGMREYDRRRAQFLSVDPLIKKYPELTPYQFASNKPVKGVDQDGKEFLDPGAQLVWNIFVQPFVDFNNGGLQAYEGTVQRTIARSGQASYNDPHVPSFVQERLAQNDIIEGISKQVSGTRKMVVSSEEISTTYSPFFMDGFLASSTKSPLTLDKSLFSEETFTKSSKLEGRTIIVDENLSPKIAEQLQANGYNSKVFPKQTSDADIIKIAKENNDIVLTNNISDFKNKGVTTVSVTENMKQKSEILNVVKYIENIAKKALKDPEIIKPGKNVNLSQHK